MPTGLDLGTGSTRIARYTEGGGFAIESMPTAVLYRGLAAEVPPFAAGADDPAAGVRCDGFPMLLAGSPHGHVPEWGNRTPAQAAHAFLRLLVGRAGLTAGDLVVAGRAAPGRLAEMLAALRPSPRAISSSVAAVTYLRHARPDLAAVSRFIVCDLGAGFLSVALCEAGPRATLLIDHIELAGASAWSDATEPFDSNDGRPDTLAEKLVAALALSQGATTLGRAVYRWRGLESAVRRGGGDWPRALTDSGGLGSSSGALVLNIADLTLTAAEFLRTCEPLADRAGSTLGALLARQPDAGWSPTANGTGTRLVLLGGLSTLWPVRESLLRAAGLDPLAPGAALVDLDATSRLEAAARGAALLAAGKTETGGRYPHQLRLPVHRVLRGEAAVAHLPLAEAGAIDYEQPERMLRDATGEPYVLTVRAAQAPLPVEIVPDGMGAPVSAVLAPATPPPPGRYRIAVGGGADGVTVVLYKADGPGSHRYVLIGSADSPGTAGQGWQAEGETTL